jgi:hypothetical protein
MKTNLVSDKLRTDQLDSVITESTTILTDISDNKIIENLEGKTIVSDITAIDQTRLDFSDGSLKSISTTYNRIFENVINDVTKNGYNADIDVKTYKAMWKAYTENSTDKFISNIHLLSLDYINNTISTQMNTADIDIMAKLFDVFNKVSKDFKEGPFEYNNTNPHLKEVISLITHTVTHTVCNYLYHTITRMLIKQIEETYKKDMMKIDIEYPKYVIGLLKQILNSSTLIKYLFKEMPEKIVKISLKIYDSDADPDMNRSINDLFIKLVKIISTSSNKILNTDENSKIIRDLNSYVVPYYIEYTNIITNELFTLTNSFFNHIRGIHDMMDIYKNLNIPS